MSDPNPLLLTLPGNNWLDSVVTDYLTSLSTPLGYSFYTGTWPTYISSDNGVTFSAGYSAVVTTSGSPAPENVTNGQQDLISYYLSQPSGSVGGFADVQFRDSFSDVSLITFQEETGGQLFISDANVTVPTAGATTIPSVIIDTYTGTGSGTIFGLTTDPLNISNVEVYISGVLLAQSNYSLSGTTLTFNTAQVANTVQININNHDFAGDIVLDNDATNGPIMQGQLDVGQQGAEAILHELCHALGLIHANADGLNAGYTGEFATEKYSIMAVQTATQFMNHPDMSGPSTDPSNPTHWVFATGLQLYDIAAIQSIYGRNYETRGDDPNISGTAEADTTYTWGTFSGAVQAFGFSATTPFIYTIWDGSGTDIINAAGYSDPVEVDLRQGHFSSIGKSGIGGNGGSTSAAVVFDNNGGDGIDHGNVAIAYYAVIENAIGGGGNDNLIGNAWNNVLYGGIGADDIYGDGFSFDHSPGFLDSDSNRPGPAAALNWSGDDVLIGGAGNDVLIGGKGNDVLHGGYDRSDLDTARSGWDSANQFPSSANNISHSADGIDTANYSRLYLSSANGSQSISAGTHGINVDFSPVTGWGTVVKGTSGADGTDTLISIEEVTGTAGDDKFTGMNGSVVGNFAGLHYQGGDGDDLYVVDLNTDYGSLRIDDTAGSDLLSLSNVVNFDFSTLTINGDFYVKIDFLNTGTLAPASVILDVTQIDLGTSIDYIDIDGRIFDAYKFVDQLLRGTQGVGQTPDTIGNVTGYSQFGSTGDDSITGSLGPDTLTGFAGNDTYIVNNAADNIIENPGEGTDLVTASISYSLTMAANVENLTLTGTSDINGTGSADTNVITGNSGNNTLDGGAGADALIGGGGNDTFIVDNTGDSVTGGAGTDTVLSSVSFALSAAVENLTMTGTNPVTGTGNGLANVITGNSGDNTLDGGAGNNFLDGGAGADTMIGGADNDTFIVDNAGDSVIAGSGTDTIQSSITWSVATSTDVENLTLTGPNPINGTGNSLNNAITGNSGNNTLDGGTGADTLIGGGGNDTFIVDNTGDSVTGGAGTDTVLSSASFALSSAVENVTLTGTGNINGTGNSLVNAITGNSGNNTLDGGAGADTLIGGGGNDTFIVDNTGDAVTAGGGTDTIQSSITWSLATNTDVENLTLTGTNPINGTGNSLTNVITGNSGNNTLDGGTGADTLIGGGGNDTYIVDNAGDSVTGGSGTDTVLSSVSFTLSSAFENLTLTGTAISGTGNSLVNVITGNSSDNSIDGGAGADTMIGGAGNDLYFVDTATDSITENASEGTDTVYSVASTYTLQVNVDQMMLGVDASGVVNGNFAGTGNGDANTIASAGVGDDTLDGGGGVDWLLGGYGNDTYLVDTTTDTITENPGWGTDTVVSSVTFSLASISNVENLTLTGTSNLNGTGNSLANVITGNSGNNTLDGGTGADTLIGGGGNDTFFVDNTGDSVTGGSGTDTVLSSASFTLSSAIEKLTLTGTADLNGTGNGLTNVITGNSGNNTLDGGTGADSLIGGGGGNDTFVVDNTSDSVTAGSGTDTIQSSISWSLATNTDVENLTLTGTSPINGTGNSLTNVVTGNSGDNTLDGGGGVDTLIGGAGNDTYIVDTTTDVITEAVSGGTDTVQSSLTYTLSSTQELENLTLTGTNAINGTGNSLNNAITGNSVVNILTGNDGNDTLDGGGGSDSLIGGYGDDTYIINNTGVTVTENSGAGTGTDTIQSSITYTLASLTNVENLTLTGTSPINGTGNSGTNIITGNSGVNILTGNGGNDTLDGGGGADTLIGGTGNDTYVVDVSSDSITDTGGTDTVLSSITFSIASFTAIDNLTLTGTGNINGTGNSGVNAITGNSGNNTLDGGTGADTMTGGAGDDTYFINLTTDGVVENLNSGNDTVVSSVTGYTLAANVENLTLGGTIASGTGNDLDNLITGNSAANILNGGTAGNDMLDGGTGADSMTGGTGDDTYYVDNVSDVIVETSGVGTGTDTEISSVTEIMANNVEILILTGTTAINGTGNGSDNTITGSSGDNILDGGTGTDTLIGGLGNDTYITDTTTDIITENLGEGSDTVQSSVTFSLATIANVENLTLTGTGTINGTGNDLNNILTGNSAVNTLTGGLGDDTYVVGTGDVVIEGSNGGSDTVQSSVTWTLSSTQEIENLTLTGTGTINGTGNDLNNYMVGNSGANSLTGGIGDDTLDGGAGLDHMIGGVGNDIYFVSVSTDVIVENANEGTDTVNSSVTYTLGTTSNLENLILTGTADINGTGNGGDNTIIGNTGENTLVGGAGNDTLDPGDAAGGLLYDTLTGGTGIDTFYFHAKNNQQTIITDFSLSDGDKINIKDLLADWGFDPLHSVLTNWVQTNNSELYVAPGNSNWSLVADVSGLGTDEAALVASGILIVS
jgi:Ca2+-binding RTX toxin-like protein